MSATFATQTLDVDELLISLRRKLDTREICLKRRSFRSDKALPNAIESYILLINKIVSTLPKTQNTSRSHFQVTNIDSEPCEAFHTEARPYID